MRPESLLRVVDRLLARLGVESVSAVNKSLSKLSMEESSCRDIPAGIEKNENVRIPDT